MSGSRFSIFKVKGFNNASTKRKVPNIKKVIVAGVGASVKCLKEINKTKSTDGKSMYGFVDLMLGARCPSSTLVDRLSTDAVAFVLDFNIPHDWYSQTVFQVNKRHLDRIINFKENTIVVVLYNHPGEADNEEEKSDEADSEEKKSDETESKEAKSDETKSDEAKSNETKSKDPDPEMEDWIKKMSEKHRVATFHVNTETKEGVEEAYEWLNEQIILDSLNEQITLDTTSQQEAKEQKIKEKTSGYRWLAKLSKAALTFGAHST